MGSLITAGVLLGILALVIGLLLFVHRRDQKRDAQQTNKIS
jgi:hypothetical protein